MLSCPQNSPDKDMFLPGSFACREWCRVRALVAWELVRWKMICSSGKVLKPGEPEVIPQSVSETMTFWTAERIVAHERPAQVMSTNSLSLRSVNNPRHVLVLPKPDHNFILASTSSTTRGKKLVAWQLLMACSSDVVIRDRSRRLTHLLRSEMR